MAKAKSKTRSKSKAKRAGKKATGQGQIATKHVKAIRALGKSMGLAPPLTPAARRRLVSSFRGATVLDAAATAWDTHGMDTGVRSFDSHGARVASAKRQAWQSVVEAAKTLVAMIEDDILTTFAPHGAAALHLYKAMTVAASAPDGGALRQDVAAMKQKMALGPRKKKSAPATPSP